MIDVERSQPAPPSLARQVSWRDQDVRKQLVQDFSRKCYLCEGRLPDAWDVEHLHPRAAGGGDFDWGNLFPACHLCNLRRLKWGKRGVKIDEKKRAWPQGGMLNPTDGTGCVRSRLKRSYTPGISPRESMVVFAPADENDAAAKNTAEELQHLFMDGEHAEQLRGRLLAQLQNVSNLINSYLRNKDTLPKNCIVVHLSKGGVYSRLIRAYLCNHQPGLLTELGIDG